ncbi:probable carboxylesterase 15 [Magnolia sinica]|uniref:probable carboxylesterase 15 n=1 Tax=Magnolia sinica TaxID=86752 RepID=UPI0026585084|nr:probable carboxylesterase 15 [Magnolia sinica]
MGTPPHEIDGFGDILRVFNDGSIVRAPPISFDNLTHTQGSVSWKDVAYDASLGLYLRLYRPTGPSRPGSKLPVFFYFHGGGFCIVSRLWPECHNNCLRLAAELPAVVVAADYRLAPENRLPAAYEDSLSAVQWVRDQAIPGDDENWVADVADLDRVFIYGDSAGANIAHHLAVRLGIGSAELAPLRVRGYVLLAPFFGATMRTRSETECPPESFLNLEHTDRFWRLSLPVGESRDHPFANPFGPVSQSLESASLDPILVVVGTCDLLRDRAEEYARRLKGWGKKVELVEMEGEQHAFFMLDSVSKAADEVIRVIKRFMAQSSESNRVGGHTAL